MRVATRCGPSAYASDKVIWNPVVPSPTLSYRNILRGILTHELLVVSAAASDASPLVAAAIGDASSRYSAAVSRVESARTLEDLRSMACGIVDFVCNERVARERLRSFPCMLDAKAARSDVLGGFVGHEIGHARRALALGVDAAGYLSRLSNFLTSLRWMRTSDACDVDVVTRAVLDVISKERVAFKLACARVRVGR